MTEPVQAPATDAPKAPNVLAYPGYVKLLGASLLGALADRFYQGLMIATANEIFQGTTEELKELGSRQNLRVQIFSILPMLILYALIGSFVDACNRRRLLVWVEGIKVFLVLGFVWLLRDMAGLREQGSAGIVPPEWKYGLGLVVLLNIVTVPFSPARASVVPDVLPEERRSMGASLIATAGLCSYLIGGLVGLQLARSDAGMLGPVKMAMVASALFAISSLLFRALPENVTIPNNRKKGEGAGPPAGKMSMREYLAEQWDGFAYCVKHPSLLALIVFESIFWTIASVVLVLINYYAGHKLALQGGAITSFASNALGLAGFGIVVGALAVGKTQRVLTPIAAYVTAFVLVGVGFMFSFGGAPETVVIDGAAVKTATWLFYSALLVMAFGGGMMLGRVDADILAIADERYRGRIFSLKAVAFGLCTLLATYFLSERLSPEEKGTLIKILPRILFWMLPLVFIGTWMVDIAIFAKRWTVEAPTLRRRLQFKFARFLAWCLLKFFFRFTAVGAEKVPASGPVILVANHGSFADPLCLGVASPRMVQFFVYSSYYQSLAHPLFRFLSCVPVDEKKHLQALKTGVASLEQGICIGIFPEGRVATEKKLNPAQGGALFMAQRSGAPVIPVALKGNWDAFPRSVWFPRFKKVTAIFGEPFSVPKDISKQDMAALTDKMMATLAQLLGVPPPEKPAAEEKKAKGAV